MHHDGMRAQVSSPRSEYRDPAIISVSLQHGEQSELHRRQRGWFHLRGKNCDTTGSPRRERSPFKE